MGAGSLGCSRSVVPLTHRQKEMSVQWQHRQDRDLFGGVFNFGVFSMLRFVHYVGVLPILRAVKAS